MSYVTPFESRIREEARAEGRAEGLRKGLLEAIELGLKLRFGTEGLQYVPAIQQLVDSDHLRRLKQAVETALDQEWSLFARKRRVIRGLYDRGMSKEMVVDLFRLTNWMMTLPEALELLFEQEHLQWEREKQMPYVAPLERRIREEGQAEGRAEGLREGYWRRLSWA